MVMTVDWTVRGLRLPGQLVSMLRTNLWHDPDEHALLDLMPWFEEPLDFLTSPYWMQRESATLDRLADNECFMLVRGGPSHLPWLDAERAVFIAVNRIPGHDVAVALDYRTDPDNPRVVASDVWSDPRRCVWRAVTPTFSELVDRLGLGYSTGPH